MNINSVNDQIKNGGCSLKPVNVLSTFKDFFQFPKLNVNARLGMIFFFRAHFRTNSARAFIHVHLSLCESPEHFKGKPNARIHYSPPTPTTG